MTKKILNVLGIISLFIVPSIWGSIYTGLYYRSVNNSFENILTKSIVEKMLYYYTLCREYEYNPCNELDYYIKLILHSSRTVNLFHTVESMIEKQGSWNWFYGDSMNESWNVIENYFAIPGWGTEDYPPETLFTWIDDNISPVKDMSIFNFTCGDFIQSPIETLYRKKGDCEDFSILGASLFESCGYETMVATIYDTNVNLTVISEFYEEFPHAFFFVKQNYTGDHSIYNYWSFKDKNEPWLLVDILWCHSFGDMALWMTNYTDRSSRYFEDWYDLIEIKEVTI
ncbi:MAG: hypothetical protein JXA54_10190 [Candidatus Heimdallarchaeota archaeon]|nr:hypothetical protein [Candidatus Heimdallarchaeota archaeon]